MDRVAEGLLPTRDRRIAQRADRVRVAHPAPERDGARLRAAGDLVRRDRELAVARPRQANAVVGRAGSSVGLEALDFEQVLVGGLHLPRHLAEERPGTPYIGVGLTRAGY